MWCPWEINIFVLVWHLQCTSFHLNDVIGQREWPQSLSLCVPILQGIYRQGINNIGYQSDTPALCVGVTHLALSHVSSIQASFFLSLCVCLCVWVWWCHFFVSWWFLPSAEKFWFLDWHKWDYIELITAVRCWIQLYDIHTVLFRMCSLMCVFHEWGML